MNQIDTGTDYIFKFEDALDQESCKKLCSFMFTNKGLLKEHNVNTMPWHEGDTFYWTNLNNELKQFIVDYRDNLSKLISKCFGVSVWPEFTDLVLWRTGKQQGIHKDNGYTVNDPLRSRVYSSITYLNDGFVGGKTFIQTGKDNYYMSVPKTGTVVIYPSNEQALHGVTKISSGTRVTIGMWFCTDYSLSEDVRLGITPKQTSSISNNGWKYL